MRPIVFGVMACLLGAPVAAAESMDFGGTPADWTGLYIGAYGAYGWGDTTSKGAADAHPRDPFGGVRAGYNTEVSGFVAGIEGDLSWSDLDDDIGSGAANVTQDLDNIAGIRARAGIPIDNMLLFATAGWAWADTEYGIGGVQDKKLISGPSIGLGVQYLATRNLSVRLDYTHYEYGRTTYDLTAPAKATNRADVVTFGLDYNFH